MSNIREKVAYVRGLAEGLGIGAESKEHRIMAEIIDLLDNIGAALDDNEEHINQVSDNLDIVIEDVTEMQDLLYEDILNYDYDDQEEEKMEEIDCPRCGDSFLIEQTMKLERELACPNCGAMVQMSGDNKIDFS